MFTTIAAIKLNRLTKIYESLKPALVSDMTEAVQKIINDEYFKMTDTILRSVGRHVQEIVNAAIAEETKRQDPQVREVIKALATDAAEEAGSAHYQMLRNELVEAATLGDAELKEVKADLNAHALELQSLRSYCKLNELALANARRQLNALKPKKKPAAKKKAPAKKAKKK